MITLCRINYATLMLVTVRDPRTEKLVRADQKIRTRTSEILEKADQGGFERLNSPSSSQQHRDERLR